MSQHSHESVTRQRTRQYDEEHGSPGASSHDRLNGHGNTKRNVSIPFSTNEKNHHHGIPTREGLSRFKHRFLRSGRKKIGIWKSIKAIVLSSWLNIFVVFIPLAWVAHFANEKHPEESQKHWPYPLTFTFSFLAIIPLERLFDYGGEQMSFYVGKDLGDLIVITLNNAVEATLAIILLTKCELKLLQSTIVGVVILHLLLIPGTAFIVGGARVQHQDLHPHLTQLNHSLLTIGVMTLLLPAAFFAALDRGALSSAATTATETVSHLVARATEDVVTDSMRATFLHMSRGLAIILLGVYVCSRIYLHNPPGDDNALTMDKSAPEALKREDAELEEEDPEVSQWVCIAMLAVTIALMAATAEWLVDSIEFVREGGHIEEEWFGLILLPIVSWSADGALAIGFFVRYMFKHFFGNPQPPTTIAKARAIDLSIQFTLFWMPFIVLLGWWTQKPMSLLFDLFEVALLIGSCFLVNYVTADSKTNWAEGYAMVSFYLMIALCAWFYPGQTEIHELMACTSVADAITAEAAHAGEAVAGHTSEAVSSTAAHASETASHIVERMFS